MDVPPEQMAKAEVLGSCKKQSFVEQAFRSFKTVQLAGGLAEGLRRHWRRKIMAALGRGGWLRGTGIRPGGAGTGFGGSRVPGRAKPSGPAP